MSKIKGGTIDFDKVKKSQRSKDMTFGVKDKLISEYLEEVRRYPQLTAEESRELPYKIKTDPNARIRMIEGNYRLPLKNVIYLVKRHSIMNSDDVMELIQAGNMALIKAVDKFDPDKGFKFSTYADFWIKYLTGEIIKNFYFERNHTNIQVAEESEDWSEHFYGDHDSSSDADTWIQHRTLYRFLKTLTPLESKIIRVYHIFQLPKKQREFECGMRNKQIVEKAEVILRKMRNNIDTVLEGC